MGRCLQKLHGLCPMIWDLTVGAVLSLMGLMMMCARCASLQEAAQEAEDQDTSERLQEVATPEDPKDQWGEVISVCPRTGPPHLQEFISR